MWHNIYYLSHFLKDVFDGTILKLFIEFVTMLFLFSVSFFWLWGMWDLKSLTRTWTCTPCIWRQSFNHWAASKSQSQGFLNFFL